MGISRLCLLKLTALSLPRPAHEAYKYLHCSPFFTLSSTSFFFEGHLSSHLHTSTAPSSGHPILLLKLIMMNALSSPASAIPSQPSEVKLELAAYEASRTGHRMELEPNPPKHRLQDGSHSATSWKTMEVGYFDGEVEVCGHIETKTMFCIFTMSWPSSTTFVHSLCSKQRTLYGTTSTPVFEVRHWNGSSRNCPSRIGRLFALCPLKKDGSRLLRCDSSHAPLRRKCSRLVSNTIIGYALDTQLLLKLIACYDISELRGLRPIPFSGCVSCGRESLCVLSKSCLSLPRIHLSLNS